MPTVVVMPRRQQQQQKQQQQKQQQTSSNQQLQPSQLDAALSVCASVEQVLWLLQAPPASSAAAATRPAFLAAALRRACSLLQQQQRQQPVRAEVRVALAATALARLADHIAAEQQQAIGSSGAAAAVAGAAAAAAPAFTLPLDTLAPLLLSVAVLKDGHDWAVGHARLRRPGSSAAATADLPGGGGASPAAASADALLRLLPPPPAVQGLDRLTRSLAAEEVCLHAALAAADLPSAGPAAAAQAAATAAYALARLGPGAARPPPALCAAMAEAVLAAGGDASAPLPPKQLALGLWGLATLRIPLERRCVSAVEADAADEWMGAAMGRAAPAPSASSSDLVVGLCAATRARLAAFNAQDLSQVLWSLATARARVPRAWLVAAARALRDRAAEAEHAQMSSSGSLANRRQRAAMFSPQAAANAAWALAVLLPRSFAADEDAAGYEEDDSSLARTASLLGSCVADAISSSSSSRVDDDNDEHHRSSGGGFAFSPQLASNASWAAARLAQQLRSFASDRHDPRAVRGTAVVEASLRSAAERALWRAAAAREDAEGGALGGRFFSARQAPTLRDCANALWSCAVLRLQPPLTWQEALWQHSAAALLKGGSVASGAEVADLAWAAARLGLSPPRAWRSGLSRAALACLPRMTRQQLANTAWASVRLGAAPVMPAGEAAAWWRAWAAAAAQAAATVAEGAEDGAASDVAAAARDASLMLFAVGTSRSAAPHAMVASAALADPQWLRRCVSAVARGAEQAAPAAIREVARSSAMTLFALAHLASSSPTFSAPAPAAASTTMTSTKTPLLPAVAEAWPGLAAPLRLLASAGGADALDAEHVAMALWAVGRIALLCDGHGAEARGALLEPARAAAKQLQRRAAALAAAACHVPPPTSRLSRTTLARLLTALASSGGSSVPSPGPRVVEPVFRALFGVPSAPDDADDALSAEAEADAAAAALALLTATRTTATTPRAAWPAALRRDVAVAVAGSWPALADPRRAAACISGLARLGALEQRAAPAPVPVLGREWLSAAQWRSLRLLPELSARDLGAMLSGFAVLSARARCAPSPEWLDEVAAAALRLHSAEPRRGAQADAAALARAALGLARMARASTGWRGQRHYGNGGSSLSSSEAAAAAAAAATLSSPAWAADLAALLVERVFSEDSALPGGTLRRASVALALLLRLSGSEEEDQGGDAAGVHGAALAALERSAAAGSLELGHLAGAVAALRLPAPAPDRLERLVARAAAVAPSGGNDGRRSERYARALLAASGW